MMKLIYFILLIPSLSIGQVIASSNQSAVGARDGYAYLASSAKAAWDFTKMGKRYLQQKDTVLDFSPNAHNAFRSGTTFNPVVCEILSDAGNSITAAICQNDNTTKKCYVSDGACTNLFNSDFEIHLTFSIPDGQIGDTYIFGLNNGAAKRIFVRVNASGQLLFSLNLAGSTISEWTISHTLPNNSTNPTYLRICCDFTTDAIKSYVNGAEVGMSLNSGDPISSITPSGFTNSFGCAIGGTRTGSATIQSGAATAILIYKSAVTGLLSTADALKVAAWSTYLQ